MSIQSTVVAALFSVATMIPTVALADGPSVDIFFVPVDATGTVVPSSGQVGFAAVGYPNISYRCVFRGVTIDPCTSPLSWTALSDAEIVRIEVTATDLQTNVVGPTASRTVTVDAVAPVITLLSPLGTSGQIVQVEFTSDGMWFVCDVDGQSFECQPGATVVPPEMVPDGPHTLTIVAFDQVGNSTRVVTPLDVDLSPPVFESGSFVVSAYGVCADSTAKTQITWNAFDRSMPVSFGCSLDGGTMTPCGTPSLDDSFPYAFTWTGLPNGPHTLAVIAFDSFYNPSEARVVDFTVVNQRPIASAGPDQLATLNGTTISLDGTQSFDPDGDAFTFTWELSQLPAGSGAALSDPHSPTPTFVADIHGDYEVCLAITENITNTRFWGLVSQPDCVSASFENLRPVASAGVNESVNLGDVVHLDGSSSSDANGDVLTYEWTLTSVPPGSEAQLVGGSTATPSFVTDVAGAYVISLIVNDGFTDSDAGLVTIQATFERQLVVDLLRSAIAVINTLDGATFKNRNMKNALTNKLIAAIGAIDSGFLSDALDKLTNDVISKFDGCALRGVGDRDDWILPCTAQIQVYPVLVDVIDLLRLAIW